eukprot:TRINITY_DN1790_c0_g1_i1.p1 TRINITY_DN1790_c0_g1~~TRINITY_DN1790_c0_g1_i1.p1  ORF type:complete len:238 (-),score=29.52 TRINITY_DN1790_c0_g1_i1:356-1069(-)
MEADLASPSARNVGIVAMRDTVSKSSSLLKDLAKECAMCGDVGFERDLVLCKRCGYRFQHTYCSKLYPHVDIEDWTCDWCLYEEEKSEARSETRRREYFEMNESRNEAFQFLLQIAQAGPCGEVLNEGHALKRQRESVDVVDLSSVNKKRSCKEKLYELCAKEEEVQGKHSIVNGTEVSKHEKGIRSVGDQVIKKQQEKTKSGVDNWKSVAKNKHFWNTSSSKAIGRRYKLLADVLC